MARRFGSATALALLLTMTAPSRVDAVGGSLVLAPGSGAAGSVVSASGVFSGYCGVRLWWEDPGATSLGDTPTSRTGAFVTEFTVPDPTTAGAHPVVAEGLLNDPDGACASPSGDTLVSSFTVVAPGTPPTAALSLGTDTAHPGEAVVLDGGGSTGDIASFDFDLDGNGSYETGCGGAKAALLVNEPGEHEVGLQVVARDGQIASTTAVLMVDGTPEAPPQDNEGNALLPFQEQTVTGTCLVGDPSYAGIVAKLWTCPQTLMIGTIEARFRTWGVNPAAPDACFERHEKTILGTPVVFFVASKNTSDAVGNPVLVNGLEFDHPDDVGYPLPLYSNELMFVETVSQMGAYGGYGSQVPKASMFRITLRNGGYTNSVASVPVSLLTNWSIAQPGVVGSAVMGHQTFFSSNRFFGLKVAKKLTPITFTSDRRATLTLHLGLPLEGFKLTTQTTAPLAVITDNNNGDPTVVPGKAKAPSASPLTFSGIKLGIFTLDATLGYQRQGNDDVWTGDMDLTFPGGTQVGGVLTVRNGTLESAHVSVGPGPPVPPGGIGPIGCCGWIYQIFGDLTPAYVAVGALFGIGPTVPLIAVRAAEVTGTAKIFYGDPWAFLITADDLKIAGIPVDANASVLMKSSGAWASAYVNQDWSVLELQANLEAKVTQGSWFGGGGGTACVDLEVLSGCGGGWAGVGPGGIAACAQIDYLPDGGVALDWDFFTGDLLAWSMWWGCAFGAIKTKVTSKELSSQQARGLTAAASIPVATGLPKALIAVTGAGAAPKIRLRGPDGRILSSAAGAPLARGPGWSLVELPHDATTYVWIRRPAGGLWKVVELPGSAPVTRVGLAEGLPQTVVRGSVTGTGRTRELRYQVADVPGIKVTFLERGGAPASPEEPDLLQQRIGSTTAGRSGTLRFTPVEGTDRQRRIEAVISVDGVPGRTQDVTSFLAPPLRKLPPPAVRAARDQGVLAVSWSAVPGADRYRVTVRWSDADDLVVDRDAGTTRVRLRGLSAVAGAVVTVQPISRSGYFGSVGSATIAAVPEVSMSRRLTIASTLRTGMMSARCTAYADGSCSLTVRYRGTVVARGSSPVTFGTNVGIRADLTGSGRRLLSSARRDLWVTATMSAPAHPDTMVRILLSR